jgi:glycosyltransferase involved in cell wall biosynthesis
MPPTQNKPRILTIHDLRRYRLPHLYKESKLQLFEKSVKLADHFIAVSEATKNDLCYFFNVPPEKVDVVHLAADENLMRFSAEEKDAVRKRLHLQTGLELQKYVIAFSSSDKRKNITRIAKAFLAAKSKMPTEYKLLIIGSLPKDDKTFLELLEKDGGKNIIAAGHVNDITEFLGGADAMVFASLYEGFGIPILEAFATGVPVITSNCSSMPEVADKAAILVDPLSEACIAEAIQQVCNNSVLRENMIVQGTEKLQQFSWPKTATETLRVYKKLC